MIWNNKTVESTRSLESLYLDGGVMAKAFVRSNNHAMPIQHVGKDVDILFLPLNEGIRKKEISVPFVQKETSDMFEYEDEPYDLDSKVIESDSAEKASSYATQNLIQATQNLIQATQNLIQATQRLNEIILHINMDIDTDLMWV
jgi:hypothetical protein